MSDSLYKMNVELLKEAGAEVVEFDPIDVRLEGFLSILNIDMKYDLPAYIEAYTGENVNIRSVQDVIDFNNSDTTLHAPYGQARLQGIVADTTTRAELKEIITKLRAEGRRYFDIPLDEYNLDAILSINNYNAGVAAVAHYPCLTVPMGYEEGEPKNLTFIGKHLEESKLLKIGYAFEQASKIRKPPVNYAE